MTAGPRRKGGVSRGTPTIYDVAVAAEVSAQTVSRYLRGYPGMKPATRKRVERAVSELEYRPNLTARLLSTAKSHRIGALAHEYGEVGGSKIIESATRGATAAGYILDVMSLDVRDSEAVERTFRVINQRELDGVIAFAPTFALVRAFSGADLAVPVHIASPTVDTTDSIELGPDGTGETELVDHLIGLGHRKFVHVAGPPDWISSHNRELAFDAALSRHGLTSRGTWHGDWSSRSGYEVGMIIAGRTDATAVVAANDQMALGVIRACHDRRIRVPDDISVVGYDDITEARYFVPSLTTAAVDFELHGRAAITQMLSMIAYPGETPPAAVVPATHLQVRESSAPPSQAAR